MTTFRDALRRLGGFLQPPVSVGEAPAGLVRQLDVDVPARDGTRLEVNVHRPGEHGRFPVILSAHPWGKDNLPVRKRFGYAVPFGYRKVALGEAISFSRMTSWQGPDPGWWVERGYAVVNADPRGVGASDGEPDPALEGEDVADLVRWCARQPWSTGSVGLLGVSCPGVAPVPELKAAVAWDGVDLDSHIDAEVPTLIGVGGLSSFYSDEALAAQLQFFDRHLRDRVR